MNKTAPDRPSVDPRSNSIRKQDDNAQKYTYNYTMLPFFPHQIQRKADEMPVCLYIWNIIPLLFPFVLQIKFGVSLEMTS